MRNLIRITFISIILLFSGPIQASHETNGITLQTNISTGKTVMLVSGNIDPNLYYKIIQTLDRTSNINTLYLDSPGGSVQTGMHLGLLILNRRLTVIISEKSICVSACAYAALASPKLIIRGVLAFHTFHVDDPEIKADPDRLLAVATKNAMLLTYYFAIIGMNSEFYMNMVNNTGRKKYMVYYNHETITRLDSYRQTSTSLFDYLELSDDYSPTSTTDEMMTGDEIDQIHAERILRFLKNEDFIGSPMKHIDHN